MSTWKQRIWNKQQAWTSGDEKWTVLAEFNNGGRVFMVYETENLGYLNGLHFQTTTLHDAMFWADTFGDQI